MTAARRTRNEPQPARVALTGLLILAAIVTVGVLALRLNDGVPLRRYTTLYADVPSVGNLQRHDFVRLGGVRIGQVARLDVTADGRARVQLQLDGRGPHLPIDSRALIRANGLLGARYLEILPGHDTRTLPARATVRAGEPSLTYGVPDVLQAFDPATRRRFGDMLDGLSAGFVGRGPAIDDALHETTITQTPIQRLIAHLLHAGRVPQLLPSLAALSDRLAGARDHIAESFASVDRGVTPFVAGRSDLQRTFDVAPASLRATAGGLRRGRALLHAVTALSTSLDRALGPAPRGLASARELLAMSHAPLRGAAALLERAREGAPATLRLTRAVSPLLAPLRQALDDLAPTATELGRYGCDIKSVGATWRSMTGIGSDPPGDAGPLGAFRLGIVPTPLEGAGLTNPLSHRDGYSPPCSYLSTTYPVVKR